MAVWAERRWGSIGKPTERPALAAHFRLATIRAWPLERLFFASLVTLYLIKQVINVFIFPPFTGHDEVAHYSYVRTVATEYRVPRIPELEEFRAAMQVSRTNLPGDYLPHDLYRYCRYILDWGYCDEARWAQNPPHIVTFAGEFFPYGWQYTANHPPLYYLLMAPLYKLSDGATPATQQYLMRAATILFGLAIVGLAYLTTRTLFPGDRFLIITMPAFVALQPQVSYESAMVNNDVTGIASFSLILYLLILGLRRGFSVRLCAAVGTALGIGLLFKGTTITIVPVIALGVILGIGPRNVIGWAVRGAMVAGIAALISWPWYLYLYRTYGNFDALDQIAALQYAYTYFNTDQPSFLDLLWNSDFAAFRWHETWGLFGWRLIYLSDALLWAIGIPCIVAAVGFIVYLLTRIVPIPIAYPRTHANWQLAGVGVIALAALVAYAAMLQFGTRFSLTQARYFFPAINAFAILLMLGLRTLLPRAALGYARGAVVAALVLLNVVIYTQYVIPYWYLSS